MKRCTKKDKEEKEKTDKCIKMKQCSKKLKSWADLDLDLLGEIKKKLYRFTSVCKSWLGAEHQKRSFTGEIIWMDFVCWILTFHSTSRIIMVGLSKTEPEPNRENLMGFFICFWSFLKFDGLFHIFFKKTSILKKRTEPNYFGSVSVRSIC